MKRLGWLLSVVAILLLAGCTKRFYLKKADFDKPSPWPLYRYDLGATGVIPGPQYAGHLDTLWMRRSGEVPSGPISTLHGYLVIPSLRKRIKFFDLSNGEYRGQIKLSLESQIGLLALDSIGFVSIAPPKNTLYGIRLDNQKTLWKVVVKDAPPGSILVSNRLIIASADGSVLCVNPSDGKTDWHFHVNERFSAPPSYGDGKLYQPSEKGIVHILSATDGKELYQMSLKGPIVSAVAVAENAYVGDVLGNLYCLDPGDGTIRWQTKLAGPIWTTPAVTPTLVIAGHSGGDLIAFDRATGRQVWIYSPVEVIKASPIVVGDYVVAGTMRGTLCVINAADGSLAAKAQLKGAIAFSPVSDGRNIYVVTQDGRILCLGERYEQPRENSH